MFRNGHVSVTQQGYNDLLSRSNACYLSWDVSNGTLFLSNDSWPRDNKLKKIKNKAIHHECVCEAS